MQPIYPNPNPRIVALLDYALDEVEKRLPSDTEYKAWRAWASAWRRGEHSPGASVRVGRLYLSERESNPIKHCLGQLAWAGKEACYSTPTSGWLVIRYIADAMTAFGVAFPDAPILALSPPTLDRTEPPAKRLAHNVS